MNNKTALILVMMGTALLPACGGRQSTPSMMNTSKPQLYSETALKQMPVKSVSEGYLYKVADDYSRYGANALQLSLAYDPHSKTYGPTQAFKDLAKIKSKLELLGVQGITAETAKAEGSEPLLMISYDSVKAAAPAGCRNMPGMDDGLTTEQVGDYRFGCSVDTLTAQQIYRPSDLQGVGTADAIDGRRATNTVEYYRNVTADEADGELNRIERSDIQE